MGDLVAGQLSLAGEDEGNGSLAAEFGDEVAGRKVILVEQETQDIDGVGIRDGTALQLVLIEKQREEAIASCSWGVVSGLAVRSMSAWV
jgi:hypothetical protein